MALTHLRTNVDQYQETSVFTDLFTHQAATSYSEARLNFFKLVENAPLAQHNSIGPLNQNITRIYDDGVGIPTFGYGYNLEAHNPTEIIAYLTHAYGGAASLTSDQEDALSLIGDWKNQIAITLTDSNGNTVTRTLTSADIIDGAQHGTQSAFTELAPLASLTLTDAQATTLLNDMLDGYAGVEGYEQQLSDALGGLDVPDSAERVALLSLYFNRPDLIGPGLRSALSTDNRAEAWYEIRYDSNLGATTGVQNRRNDESDAFGLIGTTGVTDEHLEELKQAMDFLFNRNDSNGNRVYTKIEQRNSLSPFLTAIAPQLNELADIYFPGKRIDWVRRDIDNSDSTLTEDQSPDRGNQTTNNMIFGQNGNDTLDGGAGDDALIGGTGNDVFISGAGDDLYAGGDKTPDGNAWTWTKGLSDGLDQANYSADPGRIIAVFSPDGSATVTDGFGGHDSLESIEWIVGSGHDDIISGQNAPPGLRIDGGDGNDTINGNSGGIIHGGAGNDSISYKTRYDAATMNAPDGVTTIEGGAGNDTVIGTGPAFINLGDGNDFVRNAGFGSVIDGGAGNDTINMGNNILIVNAEPGDEVMWEGLVHAAGGFREKTSEDTYAFDPTGFLRYAINVQGDLVIKDIDGHETFIQDYVGGPGAPFDLAGIFVGQTSGGVYRMFDQWPKEGSIVGWFDILKAWMKIEGVADPLVLDLNGDGIGLTAESIVAPSFDIDGDRFAEHTGWVGSDDGFLVYDKNNNGAIDDVSELFGGPTVSGFAALAAYDSNSDGVIDSSDTIFSSLRVWRDANQNAIVDDLRHAA